MCKFKTTTKGLSTELVVVTKVCVVYERSPLQNHTSGCADNGK